MLRIALAALLLGPATPLRIEDCEEADAEGEIPTRLKGLLSTEIKNVLLVRDRSPIDQSFIVVDIVDAVSAIYEKALKSLNFVANQTSPFHKRGPVYWHLYTYFVMQFHHFCEQKKMDNVLRPNFYSSSASTSSYWEQLNLQKDGTIHSNDQTEYGFNRCGWSNPIKEFKDFHNGSLLFSFLIHTPRSYTRETVRIVQDLGLRLNDSHTVRMDLNSLEITIRGKTFNATSACVIEREHTVCWEHLLEKSVCSSVETSLCSVKVEDTSRGCSVVPVLGGIGGFVVSGRLSEMEWNGTRHVLPSSPQENSTLYVQNQPGKMFSVCNSTFVGVRHSGIGLTTTSEDLVEVADGVYGWKTRMLPSVDCYVLRKTMPDGNSMEAAVARKLLLVARRHSPSRRLRAMASQQQFIVTQVGNKNNANPRLLITETWISDKNPTYPQDLELTLRYPMDLERLEIISHNQFIPNRLELMMKNGASHKSVGEVLFKHKKSERHELKTVYLDDRCTQLLFRIHGNHEHDENPYNQVGLVEVKIYGNRVPDADENPYYKKHGGAKAEIAPNKNREKKYTKELEDLNRAVNKNKERCVQEDNFRLAKQAQLAERLIAKSIGEMRQLEDDKEEAIAEEDYQRAADLTEEMKTLRAHVLASIDARLTENVPSDPDTHRGKTSPSRPDGLFDGEESIPHTPPKLFTPVDLSPDNDTKDFLKPPRKPSSQGSTRSVSSRRPRYSIPQPDPPAPPSRRRRSYERVTFRPSSKDSIISRRSNSSVRSTRPNKFMEKENMVVPAALKNRQRKIEDEESGNIRNLPVEGDDHYLAVTTPKEHGDATRAAGALGMNKIFSRNFENRKDGLVEAREIVQNATDENSRAVFDAMVFVLGKALRDPLYSVYTEALDLLRVTVCEFMPRHQMQKNGSALAATTVEPLLAKMGNTAGDKRTPQETESVFREIVNSNEKVAKGYLSPVMNSSQSGNKAEKARADIIYQSMNKYSAPNAQAGLAEDTLRRYGVKCLMSTNTDVRNVGREIVLRLYEKGDKRAVRSALPIGGKRGSLIQDIQREMDVIDRSGR